MAGTSCFLAYSEDHDIHTLLRKEGAFLCMNIYAPKLAPLILVDISITDDLYGRLEVFFQSPQF
jgi:hypothetical protein